MFCIALGRRAPTGLFSRLAVFPKHCGDTIKDRNCITCVFCFQNMPTGRVVGILFYLLRIPCAGITTTEGQFRNSICCIVSSQRVLTGLFSNIMLVFFQNTAAIQLRTVIVSLAPPYRTFQPHFVFLARPLKCLPGSLLVDTSAGIPWSSLVVV